MDHLDKLEAQSIYIFREAFNKIKNIGMFWSFGKDSTIMIHLARKAFMGKVPFPLIHCDTELEMAEVYAYRDKYVKEWGIDFRNAPFYQFTPRFISKKKSHHCGNERCRGCCRE